MSIYAFDLCLIAGAVVQCVLVLRARNFEALNWAICLASFLFFPLAAYAFLRVATAGTEDAAGFAIFGFAIATIAAGVALMDAPPRVTPTGLISLTATFAIASWPRDWGGWAVPTVAAGAAAVAWCLLRRRPTAGERLGLYVWYLWAAAGAAAGSIPYMKLINETDVIATFNGPESIMMGAQCLLFMHALVGLILLLPFSERADDPGGIGRTRYWASRASSLIDSYDAAAVPRWGALALVAIQCGILLAMRRTGGPLEKELLIFSTLAALAHGAMSGEDVE